MSKKEIAIQKTIWNPHYEIAIFVQENGKDFIALPLTLEEYKEGVEVTQTVAFSKEELQEFFNELWKLGFRPNDGTGNSGHVEAIKYHLEDMRKIAFKEVSNEEE